MAFFLINPTIDIALMTLIVTIVSTVIQYKLFNKREMNKKQKALREKQKKMSELSKKKDSQSQEEAKKIQEEIIKDSFETMKQMPKQMIVLMIVLFPLFFFLDNYKNAALPVGALKIPVLGTIQAYFVWYMLMAMVFGISIGIITHFYDKKKEKEEK